MENPMKDRVISRLAELGLKPTEGSVKAQLEAAGLHGNYINEFVTGKKKTISLKRLPIVARILGLDPAVLLGKVSKAEAGYMSLVGICEAGAWRSPGSFPNERVPFNPHPRYPAADQVAYVVRDKHAEPFGVSEGSLIIVARNVQPRPGEFIVATRHRDDGAQETTIKKVGRETEGLSSEGVVILAIKTF
jgi:SOS-response transcriptional repressor LexA